MKPIPIHVRIIVALLLIMLSPCADDPERTKQTASKAKQLKHAWRARKGRFPSGFV